MKNGIYFDLPEAEYHAIDRLSASGIKDLLVSAPTYWARSSMNPDREAEETDTLAQILGRAYHCAMFEPDAFDERFYSEADPANWPEALMTDAAVCRALKDLEETQKKSGELALERAERLARVDPGVAIWSLIERDVEIEADGGQLIAPRYYRQIERDMDRIKENPELYDMLTSGFSEVSILWTCPQSGIDMKVRLDQLSESAFIDMKSFVNSMRKPIAQALSDNIRFNRIYVQAKVYQDAVDAIAAQSLEVVGEAPAGAAELVKGIASRGAAPHKAVFFFQEKGGVPNLLMRTLRMYDLPEGVDAQAIGAAQDDFKRSATALCRKAAIEIGCAKALYQNSLEVYGRGVWYPLDMVGEVTDNDFSGYWLEE